MAPKRRASGRFKEDEMRDTTDIADAGIDKFYLEDRERWENLGLDWEGWNATIEKIRQRQQAEDAAMAGKESRACNSAPTQYSS
jgi:hypothetical protein